MNIAEILLRQSRERPDAPAIIDSYRGEERMTTFAGLEVASARGASLLLGSGLTSGDTVLVFQPMSAELYIVLLALLRAGMTAMFLDPSAGRDHIERCCAIRPPRAMIASPKAQLLRLVAPAVRRIPRHFCFSRFIPGATPWSRSECLPPHLPLVPSEPDTPALITFTSGSTGLPKGVVRSHGFLLEQHRVLERAIHLTAGTIDLTTLPVFVLANLASGVTSLIPDADLRRPGGIDAGPVLRQIERHHPASVVASPAFLERICDSCAAAGDTVTGFRFIFTGGAPVFPDHLDRFGTVFPGACVEAVYGSTEAEPIAHCAREQMTGADLAAMQSGAGLLAGMPVADIKVRIVAATWGEPFEPMDDRGFAARCLPPGEAGEIVVAGSHVLKGYLNGNGDEETKFRVEGEVWHRTGDSGRFDATGRLWLLGRSSAVIRDERGELYPFAVECAARQLPGVLRGALLGRDNRRILFLQKRSGQLSDPEEVRSALQWADLDEVRYIREIPLDRRHNAKVDYNRLTQLV